MELKDWIDLVGAIGSVAVAVVTGVLAWATYRMAKDTHEAVVAAKGEANQADRHHRENLRPFCVLEFESSDTRQYPFGDDFAPRPPPPDGMTLHSMGKKNISIEGRLTNKGLGPAKDIVVYLNWGGSIEGQAYWLTHPVVACGIIAAGESINVNVDISEHNVASVVKDGQRVPTQLLDFIAQDASEVVLRYRDIFENTFRTVHARGFPQNILADVAAASGDKEQEAKQSTRQDRPTPVFLTEEQPWQTLADIPAPPPNWPEAVDFDPATFPIGLQGAG
jgi:hypothetical protein